MAGERILIVDDNPANVVLISFLLTTNGYEVRTAAEAGEALSVMAKFHPRLILMDVQLPGMDGLELTRQLKAQPANRDVIIVALTAHAMKDDEQRARAAGCDGYLTKPIDTRTLPVTIAGLIAASLETPSSGAQSAAIAGPDIGAADAAVTGGGAQVRGGAPGQVATDSTADAGSSSADGHERAVVLVVDDQAPNRALIRAHLGGRYVVREAMDGAAALDIVRREQVDLVLLDVMMPHMSGFALCRMIKQRPEAPYLPVILLTSLGQQEDRITGLAAGADDFLTKPVNREELLFRVQTFVKLRQQDAHIRRQLSALDERDKVIRGQLEELQALDSLKDELVSLLVHDMRNPLGGIAGFLGSLEDEASVQELQEFRSDVRTALQESRLLRETLDDLLQVRLLESGTVRIHRELVEANALVKDAIASVHGAALARQVEIAPDSDAPSVQIAADRKLVRRAIENLLTNAVKYSPAGGLVSAVVRETDSEIEFEIADRGSEIPEEVRGRVFDKFGSVEAARGAARRGVGLGLYLVKLVATAHGGRATVRDREGGGTAFRLTLPRQERPSS